MKAFGVNISECGIGRLSGGRGGCSDYSIVDVENKMGDALRNLENGCEFSMGGMDSWCDVCSRRWEEMRASLDDLCQFAVLVTLTSRRIDDETWVRSVYKCLGGNSIGDENLSDGNKRNRNIMSRGLWILTGGLIATLLLIILASWHMLKKQPKSNLSQEKHDSKDGLAEDRTQSISSKEIYSATNNLNPVNFIGQGIAGKVYKGVLSNGLRVAIKHIIKDGHVETFVREVTSLSHVRHPNLVTLLGYCDEEDDCFLVYELCANGNLSEWLFGKDKVLSWTRRLEIAIDSGDYGFFTHILKDPTNILLGTNFEAKLSDFGLSKIIDSGISYVSSEVRGTFGYVDPEYRQNHHVNPSGDVYSFGIVLLQILSGQRVINLNVKRPMPLDKMAKLLTRGGKITDFVDPKLGEEYSKEAFELTVKLALSCTAHKQQRPSMERVVASFSEVHLHACSTRRRRSSQISNEFMCKHCVVDNVSALHKRRLVRKNKLRKHALEPF
ncbi:putative receptor-like protein kinase [Acorus calamus]|uniref:Receptor-like protein kinase n=1 Tax=Acorus calamus TaxID=4465 RepID=A0AAV9CVU9_ACOCL|nr:putative receptor-like protein kinase [Acorus calamus]